MGPLSSDANLDDSAPDERRLSAVMHADVAGYSRLIGLDDAGTVRRLRGLRRELIDPAVRASHGRIVNTAGDSMMLVFDSIDGALQCALKVQQQMPVHEGDQPSDRRIRFRVGIHIADVIADGTDVHGDGVNIAARLQTACPVGGICVSRAVREHAQIRLGLDFEPLGPLMLKNIGQPMEAFVLRLDPDAGPPAPAAHRRASAWMLTALAALLLSGGAGAVWWLHRDRPPAVAVPPPTAQATAKVAPPVVGLSQAPPLSLVVLPFDNLGGEGMEDYVVDGISEDLTTDLSRVTGLLVIARQSALTYKGKRTDVRRVGEELGVRYVLEGSVRKIGNAYRVNAKLVSAETGSQLWADRFDVEPGGLGIGQNEIAQQLASVLGMEVVKVEAARSENERPSNPDVYDLILRARALRAQPVNMDRNAAAQALYERALQLEPSSAAAMAGLATLLLAQRFDRGYWLDGNEKPRVEKLVADARFIAPTYDDSLGAAALLFELQGRYHEAVATGQRMVELNPNSYRGYLFLARSKIYMGQTAEAIPLLAKAIRLNPRDPYQYDRFWRMGFALITVGRYQEAIDWLERAMAAWPDAPVRNRAHLYWKIAVAHALNGEIDDARRAAMESHRLFPFYTVRMVGPEDPASAARAAQMRQVQEGLRMAGFRDHAEEDADFSVPPDRVLRADLFGYTPTTASGATTIRTVDLGPLLAAGKPVVLDCTGAPMIWGRSVPGAIGLRDSGVGGSFSDGIQDRLGQKMKQLASMDFASPIVVVGWNSENFGGRNLALRLVALGYTHVYWYRGGREAWEVANMPETELVFQDW